MLYLRHMQIGGWRIGKLAGIDLYIHPTFWLLVLWFGLQAWLIEKSVSSVVENMLFILAVFGCVTLHELGHALAARQYNIQTKDIVLMPIGGVARLERMPTKPLQELWIALAGPLVNLFIAGVLFTYLLFTHALSMTGVSIEVGSFAMRLMLTNLFLMAFNLLPAFPMDGGRVTRALLATRLEYAQATQIAATLGRAMAVLFGIVGILTNPFLLLIAFFVWTGAGQEARSALLRSAIAGVTVSQAMVTQFQVLSPTDPVAWVLNQVSTGYQQEFPVLEEGQVVGIITQDSLVNAAPNATLEVTTVSNIMRRDFLAFSPDTTLEEAIAKMQAAQLYTAIVEENGRLIGLLTPESINSYLMYRDSMTQRAK